MAQKPLFAMLIGSLFLATTANAQVTTPAAEAIIYDYDTSDILFCKDCEKPTPPSSMSKLMTVELAFQRLKQGRLKLTDTFHVSESAWRQGLTSNESRMFLNVNSDVPIDDLLKGIIVQSGGDATIVMAEGIAGSEAAFADLENKRAAEIGLTQSHFTNASGVNAQGEVDPAHVMSARDIALLSAHIIRDYPEYYHYFAIPSFTWNTSLKGKPIVQGNRNTLLEMNIGVDGLKTGHTEAAGYGMVASALRDGRRIIVVVNGLGSMAERANEARRLLDAGYRDFRNYKLFAANAVVGAIPVFGGSQEAVNVMVKNPVSATLNMDSRKDMKVALRYTGPAKAPIEAGAQVGNLVISAPGKPETAIPVYAVQGVSRTGIFGKIWLGLNALLGNAS